MEVSALERHARGRVWTGADARERGLVDELGGLRTAIEVVARRTALDPERIRAVPVPQVSPLQRLIPPDSSESPVDAVATSPEGILVGAARAAGLGTSGALAMPWRLTIR